MNQLLDSALAHAARGWRVFPLAPGDKVPPARLTDWQSRATTDPERIRRAWTHAPYNIGVACGPSRLVVIDLDTPKPGEPPPPEHWRLSGVCDGGDVLAVLAERAGQPLPVDTYAVRTGRGGLHLYFLHPESGPQLRNTQGDQSGGLGWKVDTRAHGGQVVAAGSTVNRRRYRVVHDVDPAPLPGWLAQALAPAPLPAQEPVTIDLADGRATAYVRAAVDAQVRAVLDSLPGARNAAVYRSAVALGQLAAGGALTHDQVIAALTPAALAVGQTPRETARTIASGLKTGARRPRAVAA